MRRSHQREAILDYLRSTRRHPTAEDTFLAVRRRIPSISLATIYRNLGQLVTAGLARELPGRGQGKRFDADLEPHHHFICECCGKVEDVYPGLPSSVKEAMIKSIDHPVNEFRLQFYGLCTECEESKSREVQ
jgi:Fe2+ or Zn2+ uptake regulation protein